MKACILTEGGFKIGLGHISRSYSIYQVLKKVKIKTTFIVNSDILLNQYYPKNDFIILNWTENFTKIFSYLTNETILFVDSYNINRADCNKLAQVCKNIVFFDDFNRILYPKGIVVNGAINAENLNYPINSCIEYLLGPYYQPLRKAFWNNNKKKEIKKKIKYVLLTLGGSKLDVYIIRIIKNLNRKYPFWKIYIIYNYHIENKNTNNYIYRSLKAEHLKKIMMYCDIAISGGGQTLYELARVGIPSIVVKVEKNQQNIINGFLNLKAVLYAGNIKSNNLINNLNDKLNLLQKYSIRNEIYNKAKKILDGQGALRIVEKVYNSLLK